MLKGMLSRGTGYKFEIDQVFSSSRNSVITFTLKEDFMKFPVQWWNFKITKVHELHWILSLMWLSTTNRKIDTFFSYKVIHSDSLMDWHALESWLHWSQFTEMDLSEVWLLFSDSQSTHWITCVALSERNSFSTRENFYDFWEKKLCSAT